MVHSILLPRVTFLRMSFYGTLRTSKLFMAFILVPNAPYRSKYLWVVGFYAFSSPHSLRVDMGDVFNGPTFCLAPPLSVSSYVFDLTHR